MLSRMGLSHYATYRTRRPNFLMRRSASGIHWLSIFLLSGALLVPVTVLGDVTAALEFQLNGTCPASFEPHDGGCVLRNRYREYRSLRDAGVGGLKTGLPPLREGFTPQQIDLGR